MPKQEEPASNDDHRAGQQANVWYVTPCNETDDERPDQEEIIERRHRRGGRQRSAFVQQILRERIGYAAREAWRRR